MTGTTEREECEAIAAMPGGGYVLSGMSEGEPEGTVDPAPAAEDEDVHIIRLDAYGNTVWQALHGGTGLDEGQDVLALQDGSCLVVARSAGNINGLPLPEEGDYEFAVMWNDSEIFSRRLHAGKMAPPKNQETPGTTDFEPPQS